MRRMAVGWQGLQVQLPRGAESEPAAPHGKSGSSYCRAGAWSPTELHSGRSLHHKTITPSHDDYPQSYGDVVKRHSRLS